MFLPILRVRTEPVRSKESRCFETAIPIDKVAWLGPTGIVPPGDPQSVSRDFGISWSTDHWVYDHRKCPSPLILQPCAFSVGRVAAAGREPDFFELLQAAILTGSLGAECSWRCYEGESDGLPGRAYEQEDHHILSIGAAIFDQYDNDSVPNPHSIPGRRQTMDGLWVEVFHILQRFTRRVAPVPMMQISGLYISFSSFGISTKRATIH